MKKNINNKESRLLKMNHIRILAIALFFTILCNSAYSAPDEVFLKYNYEENGGSIVFDNSRNGFDALISGMSWSSDSYFGDYAGRFDGNNDYIYTYVPAGDINEFTICSFVKPLTSTNTDEVLMDIKANSTNKFAIHNIRNTDEVTMEYIDETGSTSSLQLNNRSFPVDSYTHFCIFVDPTTDYYEYYENNVSISNGSIPDGYSRFTTDEKMTFGSDLDNTLNYEGLLDSTLILDFEPNSTQINDIYTNNALSLRIEEDGDDTSSEEIDNLIEVNNMIINYFPQYNDSFSVTDDIIISLNYTASCEFYLDSQLYESGEGQVNYKFAHDMSLGNYTGSLYCYYDSGITRYYEYIPNYEFRVVKGDPSTIKFNLESSEFSITDESLYLTTPCLEEFSTVGTVGLDHLREINNNKSVYIQKVSDASATFTLSSGSHEFCLVNGQLQYTQNNYSKNFKINEVTYAKEVGNFELDSNVTQSYTLTLGLFDVYGKTNPKSWGHTWQSIINSIILFILGLFVTFAGLAVQNGKITLVGSIILLSAFGISIGALFGVIF